MFEKSLAEKVARIFDIKEVTFDRRSESFEQRTLFIEVTKADVRVKDARCVGRVTGRISIVSPADALPFGYLSKHIAEASPLITKDFFFSDFEESSERFVNIDERSLSFLYLFNMQYDPAIGQITELNSVIVET